MCLPLVPCLLLYLTTSKGWVQVHRQRVHPLTISTMNSMRPSTLLWTSQSDLVSLDRSNGRSSGHLNCKHWLIVATGSTVSGVGLLGLTKLTGGVFIKKLMSVSARLSSELNENLGVPFVTPSLVATFLLRCVGSSKSITVVVLKSHMPILMVLSLVLMLCGIILHPSTLALVYHPLVLLLFHRLMIMSPLILRPFLRMTHLALVLVLVLVLVLDLVLALALVFLLFRLTLLLTRCVDSLYAKLLALIICVQRCFFPFANK